MDIKKLQLQDQFEAHLMNIPEFDAQKVLGQGFAESSNIT
jgi:hypothetical protein